MPGCPPPCLIGLRGFKDANLTESRFSYPSSVTIAQNKTLLVVDNHRVRRVSYPNAVASIAGVVFQNRVLTVAGLGVNGDEDGFGNETFLNKPVGLESDAYGRVYISESAECRLRRSLPAYLAARAVTCATRALEVNTSFPVLPSLTSRQCVSSGHPPFRLFLL